MNGNEILDGKQHSTPLGLWNNDASTTTDFIGGYRYSTLSGLGVNRPIGMYFF
ncbi:MAG: hypothetical protein PSX81_05915 [bacterium]|nr:hypothetical protein [bacterium]